MDVTINPFQQIYVADDIQNARDFVKLFSAKVLQSAIHPIFQEGNVALIGTQGCGKSMVLTLLRPHIQVAYHTEGIEFPVPKEMRRFIAAGVNLTKDRLTNLVQVTLNSGEETDLRELPLYFADLFNYLVVNNLIESLETMVKDQNVFQNPRIFNEEIGRHHLDALANTIAKNDCWSDYLVNVSNLEHLKQRIGERIGFYRRWANGNYHGHQPPDEIRYTKTGVGEPIAQVAMTLRQQGLVADRVAVLILVDQVEELHRAFLPRQKELLLRFRTMLNQVFTSRDGRVHYRVGSRPYGWNKPEYMRTWSSDAPLENLRDYRLINMDEELFVGTEQQPISPVFKKLLIDAFQRRVEHYLPIRGSKSKPLAESIFGPSPTPVERLRPLKLPATDTQQIDRALALDSALDTGQWTPDWKEFLRKQYQGGTHTDMFHAVLAAAWGRQTGGARSTKQHREFPPPSDTPWINRKWWLKERRGQAILQLMTRNQQRFMWWGYDDIRSLSGGNITVFFHICHIIWDGFLKRESTLPQNRRNDILNGGTIDFNVQAAGILFASKEWFRKLTEEPDGHTRQAFVQELGKSLNTLMLNDLSMSYPGGNGISIALTDYNSDRDDIKELRHFLDDAVGYGALCERVHTSKVKSQGRRKKVHLSPILCPLFQLPETRTKEPYYWTMDKLMNGVAKQAKVPLPNVRKPVSPGVEREQMSLSFEDSPRS